MGGDFDSGSNGTRLEMFEIEAPGDEPGARGRVLSIVVRTGAEPEGGLGKNRGDFYVAATYAESGAQHGEMVLSQAFIDQLRALAE